MQTTIQQAQDRSNNNTKPLKTKKEEDIELHKVFIVKIKKIQYKHNTCQKLSAEDNIYIRI